MDGLRKVPDNVPNQAMLTEYLGKPLTQIPDPFGTHESFAHHNNAMLRSVPRPLRLRLRVRVLDRLLQPAAASTTVIRKVLRSWDAIMGVMLPTLREDRRQTYSPMLPISPSSGRVLQVPVEVVDAEAGLIAFDDEDGAASSNRRSAAPAKLQWKVDWAARWVALGVDYEMAGKDLIDSVVQSGKIARILGGRPPEGFNYEMFLDEKGEKISKSKGNGLTLDEWLRYGSEPSLAFYIYREPKRAKSLHIGVIPRAVDEYWQFRGNYPEQPVEQKLGNPVHHIHAGKVPTKTLPLTYGLLLNLVSLPGVADKDTAWRFVQRYAPGHLGGDASRTRRADRSRGQLCARFRRADPSAPRAERRWKPKPCATSIQSLRSCLPMRTARSSRTPYSKSASAIRSKVCAAGSRRSTRPCSARRQGPRMGSFIALYGIDNSRKLIAEALASGA